MISAHDQRVQGEVDVISLTQVSLLASTNSPTSVVKTIGRGVGFASRVHERVLLLTRIISDVYLEFNLLVYVQKGVVGVRPIWILECIDV